MKVYNNKGEEIDLATEEYVNNKIKIFRNVNWGVGEHKVDLKDVKGIFVQLQNSGNALQSHFFTDTSYVSDTIINVGVEVNFEFNYIKLTRTSNNYVIKSYLLLY